MGQGVAGMDKSLFNNELDLSSSMPLYEQLVLFIKNGIDAQEMKTGDLLPSESEFCERYDISRSTVRQAFAQLEEEGLVIRKRGKGSFVSKPKLTRSLHNLYSFSEEISSMGLVPGSKVLAYEVITPGEEIMAKLALFDSEEKVYSITRVRYAGEEPLALEMAFIPKRMCRFLTQEMVEQGSLYSTLAAKSGIEISHAKETYETSLIGENEAKILGTPKDTCAFFIQRISYTKAGEIFEYTVMIVRSDRCKYEVELTADNVSLSRKVD